MMTVYNCQRTVTVILPFRAIPNLNSYVYYQGVNINNIPPIEPLFCGDKGICGNRELKKPPKKIREA